MLKSRILFWDYSSADAHEVSYGCSSWHGEGISLSACRQDTHPFGPCPSLTYSCMFDEYARVLWLYWEWAVSSRGRGQGNQWCGMGHGKQVLKWGPRRAGEAEGPGAGGTAVRLWLWLWLWLHGNCGGWLGYAVILILKSYECECCNAKRYDTCADLFMHTHLHTEQNNKKKKKGWE